MSEDAWTALENTPTESLRSLFAAEPDRLSRLVVEESGIRFDFSKTHLSKKLIDAFLSLAAETGLAARRDAMFAGELVNPTEGRAAEHSAERGQGAPDSVARAAGLHVRMRALIDAIEAEAFGPVRHILHIGIGGSALGPRPPDRRARPRRPAATRRPSSPTSTAPRSRRRSPASIRTPPCW